jgi:rare lipoprotein A (peptidoglycan hydrolase)
VFNLGDSCCACVRLLHPRVEALGNLIRCGAALARLAPFALAGGLTACSQMDSTSMGVGSSQLRSDAAAFSYAAGAGPVSSTATGAPVVRAAFPTGSPPSADAGVYKVGAPYNIGGKWYVPKHEQNYNRVGLASWYGPDFQGHRTANGEIYDMNGLTAAHQTLPMPCYARVTNVRNGHSVVVRINDRGPFKPQRIIDLSGRAAELLGFRHSGVAPVRVEYVGLAPLTASVRSQPVTASIRSRPVTASVRSRPVTANQPLLAQYPDAAKPPQPPKPSQPAVAATATAEAGPRYSAGAFGVGKTDRADKVGGYIAAGAVSQ